VYGRPGFGSDRGVACGNAASDRRPLCPRRLVYSCFRTGVVNSDVTGSRRYRRIRARACQRQPERETEGRSGQPHHERAAERRTGRGSLQRNPCATLLPLMLRLLTFSRLVALALLLCIGQDLAGDLACDQTMAAPASAGMTSTSTDGDECRTLCVPDCFCCCRGVSADVSALLLVDRQVATAPSLPYRLEPSGVPGSIFRPPLHHA